MPEDIETLLVDKLEEECWSDRPDLNDLKKTIGGETHGYTLEQDTRKNIWLRTPEGETLPVEIHRQFEDGYTEYVCRVG